MTENTRAMRMIPSLTPMPSTSSDVWEQEAHQRGIITVADSPTLLRGRQVCCRHEKPLVLQLCRLVCGFTQPASYFDGGGEGCGPRGRHRDGGLDSRGDEEGSAGEGEGGTCRDEVALFSVEEFSAEMVIRRGAVGRGAGRPMRYFRNHPVYVLPLLSSVSPFLCLIFVPYSWLDAAVASSLCLVLLLTLFSCPTPPCLISLRDIPDSLLEHFCCCCYIVVCFVVFCCCSLLS